jgi:plasmid stabilization system protein ParE
MAKFRLTRAAERDLQEIKDYIARDSVDAAARVLDRLERAFHELVEMPGMGHRREDLTREDVRFWSVFEYLIVYEPDAAPLGIVRVLHGRRDVSDQLEPD